jgi:hypothetical protein
VTVAKNGERPFIVPVVDDVLQEVRIATARHVLEEVPADCTTPVRETSHSDLFAGAVRDMWLVEDDSVEMRVSRQDSYEQRTAATSDVNDGTEGREVGGPSASRSAMLSFAASASALET